MSQRIMPALSVDEAGMTLFEVLIVLLVLVLVTLSTIYITKHIDHSRLQSQKNVKDTQNLTKQRN